MTTPQKGQTILIPVEVGEGAFSSERLITLESIEGTVSGFIKEHQVKKVEGSDFLEAVVEDVDSDRVAVRLHGSFFTTTGLAYIAHEDSVRRAA